MGHDNARLTRQRVFLDHLMRSALRMLCFFDLLPAMVLQLREPHRTVELPRRPAPSSIPKFPLTPGTLALSRPTRPGSFFDVVGRRSAVFGYENRALEAWVYPLKILDDFKSVVSAGRLPAGNPGPRHRGRDRSPARGDDLHLRARGVHGAPDHHGPDRRARDRHAPRRPEHLPLSIVADRSGPACG